MNTLVRVLLGLAFIWLGIVLFSEARGTYEQPDADPSKLILLFAGVVLVGGCGAVFFVVAFMPAVGDAIGNFFFNPNEKIEKSPHADAMAAVARGDYPAAIEEYRRAFEKNPDDTHAVSEIMHLYCDKLHDPGPAAECLEQALDRDWPPEEAAFLSSRLVDVYWKHQHDARRARALLIQIIEALPNTKYAANASHKLQEIERQLAQED